VQIEEGNYRKIDMDRPKADRFGLPAIAIGHLSLAGNHRNLVTPSLRGIVSGKKTPSGAADAE
jgi:hypothetical protein